MATTLYGWTWVGTDEPSTGVLATQQWVNPTTGDLYTRNTSNTSWIYTGNVNSSYGGAVAKSGDTMTGPLLGATNLPPIQDPDFQGTIEENGFPLATQLALAQLQQDLKTYIDSTVRAQFLSQTKLSGTAASIAVFSDALSIASSLVSNDTAYAFSVPLPTFKSDGVQATIGQVIGHGASLAGVIGGGSSSFTGYNKVVETSTGSMSYNLYANFGEAGTFIIHRWSIAVR